MLVETHEIDRPKVDAFGARILEMLNAGGLALMVSLGHRARLFDVMAGMAPSTSVQIAQAAELNERYVREWLGAMVVGGIVEHDHAAGGGGTYWLPPERAACLTREAAPNNLAAFMQHIPLLGGVEEAVLGAFKHGRGVPYAAYGRFHEVMAEDSGQTVLPALLGDILPLAPGLVRRMEAGIAALDVGCGSGRAINLMAGAFPRSRFTGLDISEEAVGAARAEAARLGITNARFEVLDAAELERAGAYDLITAFDAIHDQARPARVLQSIARALRPGGVFLMQDIAGSCHVHKNRGHPMGAFIYTVSCMHCMSVSLAAGGAGLGAAWGRETAERMLREAGFTDVRRTSLPHDVQNEYYVARKEREAMRG